MYSTVVMELPKEDLEHRLRAMKEKLGVKLDTDVPASGWKELVQEYKANFREKTGKDFPENPMEQLWGAIGAVFGSWMAEKAVTYRRVEKITGLLGTAVNVMQMVFGNTGDTSGTGVCFTRDPSSSRKILSVCSIPLSMRRWTSAHLSPGFWRRVSMPFLAPRWVR